VATYWCDPFLEATTQGAGTTDTTTKNGTYAAPFSIDQLDAGGTSAYTAVNGVTISDGDEVRLKGIAFSTLFESIGNCYSATDNPTSGYGGFRPVTGNSSFDGVLSTTKSSLFALQNSDISSFLPNHSHPAFFAAKYTSDQYVVYSNIDFFINAVVERQLGYGDASDTGIEVFRVKDTYANPRSLTGGSASHRYMFQFANKVKLTAGWTSETDQDGYSIFELNNTTNYRYLYINQSTSNKTQYDCERLVICLATRGGGSTGYQTKIQFNVSNSDARAEATAHVCPMFAGAYGMSDLFYPAVYSGDTTVFPYNGGSSQYTSSYLESHHGLAPQSTSVTYKNIIINGYFYIKYGRDLKPDVRIGNIYSWYNNTDDGIHRALRHDEGASGTLPPFKYTFLQNSVYYIYNGSSGQDTVLQPVPRTGNQVTYESGLKKPGLAPLDNLASSNAAYGPNHTGLIESSTIFADTRENSTSNDWFVPLLGRGTSSPIVYNSLAKLVCNSNNYRTTANNIRYQTPSAISATDSPQFFIWSAEHNDFDEKPVSLIGDPYTAGISYTSLMYNDTVNSQSVLVGQWAGTTGGQSSQAWIPLELVVPSYTAGSDNLRVTVSTAYADGASNSAAGSILLRAWHRDTTQTNNFRVYSSSATAISAGGNAASPTTVTLNLTNVPTSGQEDITSVCLGIRLNFTDNTNLQKYYITNAAVETY